MKKWISIAMTVVFILLAGCTAKTQGTTSSSAPGGAKEQAPQKTSFTMARGTLAIKGVEVSPDINKDKWVLELEKRTNVDVNIMLLPHKEFKDKVSLMFAGNDVPDMLVAYQSMTPASKDMRGAVENKIFMPLDDLLKKYGQNLLKAIPKEAWAEVTLDGKIYAVPQYLSVPSRRATFIRTDLLEKTGLSVPKTIDETLNVLRAFKKLGVEQPFAFRENFKYADSILGAYDVMPYSTMYEKQGDQVVPKFFDSENMMKALTVYKTMYDEGLIAKDFATQTGAMWTKARDSGKAGMWNFNASGLVSSQSEIIKVDPKGKVDLIPSPIGPDGKGGMMIYGSTLEMAYLNSKLDAKKAEGIIRFLDYMASEQGIEFFSFGIENDTYKKENGKIVYSKPTAEEAIYSEDRLRWLHIISDGAYNKLRTPFEPRGNDLIKAFEQVLPKEGRGGYTFDPELSSYSKFPDLAPKFDEPSKLILDHMIKMIYNKESISDWPKVIEEWKTKGGNEIIKEATDRVNKKSGVLIGPGATGN